MSLFNLYISANLIVCSYWLLFFVWNKYSLVSNPLQFKILRFLVLFLFLTPLALSLFRGAEYTVTTAQVWAAPAHQKINLSPAAQQIHISPFLNNDFYYSIPTTKDFNLLFVFFFIGFLVIFIQFILDNLKLRKIIRQSHSIKHIGKVDIRISDHIEVPFACWSPLRKMTFLPNSMVSEPRTMKLSIYHEFQHHRQGDTQFAYLLAFLKALFFFNPFMHLWEKQILEIQEYACDEAVVGHSSVSPQDYGHCLIEVAQNVLLNRRLLFGTASMAAGSSKHQLTRRLRMLFNKKKRGNSFSFSIIVLSIVSITAIAFGSKSMIKDRRIDMGDALRYQKNAQASSRFPIDINPSVVRQLNRFLGTPDGRRFIQQSLVRMEKYKVMIEEKMNSHNIPAEFLALPLIESGYKNISQADSSGNSAGLWQFIKSTAKHFGMTVNEDIDERLNEEKETVAAMRYLHRNNLVFQDWRLALMSYNMGEKTVFDAIRKAGTRDPWKLIEKGFEGDPDYLAKFMAAVLIMKNPHILE